jgi:hypothetical protein
VFSYEPMPGSSRPAEVNAPLLYTAMGDVIERIGSGGVLSIPDATLALDRWRRRAGSMGRDGLAHGAGLSAAIADELAAAIETAKHAQDSMKPNLTLVTADPGPTARAADASRRAYAQSAEQARSALEGFAKSLKQLSADAAEIASLAALPPGPRERARRLATTLGAELAGLGQSQIAAERSRIRLET